MFNVIGLGVVYLGDYDDYEEARGIHDETHIAWYGSMMKPQRKTLKCYGCHCFRPISMFEEDATRKTGYSKFCSLCTQYELPDQRKTRAKHEKEAEKKRVVQYPDEIYLW